jgi:serine/threonine-protein phosphatase 2A regulatory subunit B
MGEQWRYVQKVGDESMEQNKTADTITAVQYNANGNYLAVGDKAGRVWIHVEKKSKKFGPVRQYEYLTHFQSHKHDIDYLKSQDIEEKINMIRWCPNTHSSQMILTTNDKTIKLFRLHQHFVQTITNLNRDHHRSSYLRIPVLNHVDTVPSCTLKSVFTDAHTYHINAISLNSDHETFISSDDLRINMWNFSVPNVSFNIVDIKPEVMEELNEVITSSQFHPQRCNQLIYSTSRGMIKLMDLRKRSQLTEPDVQFECEGDSLEKSFFSEIVSSISDATFTPDGEYIVSRDYLYVKLWDVRSPKRPVQSIPIHDPIRPMLSTVYENDSIFDKFEIAVSSSTSRRRFITGSYTNEAVVYDWSNNKLARLAPPGRFDTKDSVSSPVAVRSHDFHTPSNHTGGHSPPRVRTSLSAAPRPAEKFDFNSKCLHVCWHPTDDVVAVACKTELSVHQYL